MLMAKELFPFLDTPLAGRVWQILIATLAGACGTIIVVYFLSGIAAVDTVASLLDWIVGFNTALSGYMLMDKSGGRIRYRQWFCAGVGLLNGALSIAAVNYIYLRTVDFPLIETADAGILLTIGAVCGALGGLLAKKYLELKHKPSR